jgi:glycerophosphoryl diester phosphodiesterase
MPARPLVLGHRGASRGAPENTLAAFALARSQRADGVELDVRRTADGVAVISHDAALEGFGVLRERPFEQLRAAHPEVPTLGEALAELAGLLVNIEMKCLPWDVDPDPDGEVPALVLAAIEEHGAREHVIVSSFDLGALGSLRALDARLPLGWLTSRQEVAAAAPLAAERGMAWFHPDRAAVFRDVDANVKLVHDLGLKIDVWTVNEPDDVRALAAAGADALITDTPDVALAALDGSGTSGPKG